MGRRLTLQRETLVALETDELRQVVAAQWTPWCPFIIEVREKVEELVSNAAC